MEGLSYETIMICIGLTTIALRFVDCEAISKQVGCWVTLAFSRLFQRVRNWNKKVSPFEYLRIAIARSNHKHDKKHAQILDRLEVIEDSLDKIREHQHIEYINSQYRYKRHH